MRAAFWLVHLLLVVVATDTLERARRARRPTLAAGALALVVLVGLTIALDLQDTDHMYMHTH